MALKSILLLTSAEEFPFLANWLRPFARDAAIISTPTLAALEAISTEQLAASRLIAFATPVVVPARILNGLGHGAYNLHPGSPQYPGWAPASFALYDDAPTFGVTLHEMREKVDSGPIVAVDFFAVPPGTSLRKLEEIAYAALARMFHGHAAALAAEATDLRAIGVEWSGAKTSRKTFGRLCDIPLDIAPEDLLRRVRAFGPGDGTSNLTITLHGHRFKFVETKEQPEASVARTPTHPLQTAKPGA